MDNKRIFIIRKVGEEYLKTSSKVKSVFGYIFNEAGGLPRMS